MSNLHSEIMNLPARPIAADEYDHKLMAYKCGHRDARHDAAELSVKYEMYIEAVENLLLESIGAMLGGKVTRNDGMGQSIIEKLRKDHNV